MTSSLRILLLGGGGREHALAWKLAESPIVSHVFCVPGNAGTSFEPFVTNFEAEPGGRAANIKDPMTVLNLARRIKADLTVVGPEEPLAAGVADVFAEAGLALFGPTKAAARLESSKAFAKDFMTRHAIPTARYEVADTATEAAAALDRFGAPVVVKADGLAAGKGVVVAADRKAAEEAIHRAMDEGAFGEAGRRVVVEEYLEGPELSILAVTDGESLALFPPAQDHKRAFDGDTGPNTGGMGAYCPARVLGEAAQRKVVETILLPAIRGLADEGTPLRGVIYAGLVLTRDGPRVLEYNCRFGDPETQAILPLVTEDLGELFYLAATGSLDRGRTGGGQSRDAGAGGRASGGEGLPPGARFVSVSSGSSVCVVMASEGYPGPSPTGRVISGLEVAGLREGVKIFHAGTRREGRKVVTAGGRVLGVAASAPALSTAVTEAYRALALIHFEGAHYRGDIAAKAM